MAAMIEAKDAKAILGCDDETLNGHINKGGIRAQRSGGKLMLNAEDVQKLAASQDDDDGTIVLTGESDNLQIDLGSVIDDTSATIVSDKPSKAATTSRSDSLTFGDELEVISFDEPAAKTSTVKPIQAVTSAESAISFEENNTVEMSFTDQNTAVVSSVDQTAVGLTTDTSNYDNGPASSSTSGRGDSSRRSVRSNRVRIEAPPVHWVFPLLLAASSLVMGLLVLPYNVMSMWPVGDERDAHGMRKRGVDDGFFSSFASSAAGFTVEPDADQFRRLNGDGTFVAAPGDEWRHRKYRGEFKKVEELERAKTYVIDKVSEDGKTATNTTSKRSFPIVEQKTADNAVEEVVDITVVK